MNADDLLFGIGSCLCVCAIVVFFPLVPSIGGLVFHYSRIAHFSIISDVRFILTIAFGVIGCLFIIVPSLGAE